MDFAERARRVAALGAWGYLVWVLLTWTATAEDLLFGAALALGCAVAMAPMGAVVGPWSVLRPRRFGAIVMLVCECVVRIVIANLSLTRRILSPSRPLRSGMVVVATDARSDGEVAATGVLTSLVVDNQLVDVDRRAHRLQYHAMSVPKGSARQSINGPLEDRVIAVSRGGVRK